MKRVLILLVAFTSLAFGQASGVGQIWSTVSGTLQSGATANGNGTALAVTGLSVATLTVNCSVACSGGTTINFEGTEDNTNYVSLLGAQLGTTTVTNTVTNQGTTPTIWSINVAGLQTIRARISAYSAGTITVTGHATATPSSPYGVTASVNNGATDAGTVRVTVSNDSTGQIKSTNWPSTVDTNSGNKSASTPRVVIATDQPPPTSAWKVDGSAVNQPVVGAGASGATKAGNPVQVGAVFNTTQPTVTTGQGVEFQGTARGAIIVAPGVDAFTVQPGNTANTTPWLVQPVPGTTGGLTNFVLEAAASDNHTNIKNGAGVVYHIQATNNSATINYLRLYNAATGFNGCNSATNLLYETEIPASTSGAGVVDDWPMGITFGTGISICVTGAFGQTSTTSATASAIEINIGYK